MTPSPKDVTQMLNEWGQGHREALDRLMPLVYDELRRLADHYLRRERPDHTLEATGLVHEAYLRLVDQKNVHWQSRAHFFGIAANLMRRILVDYARRHHAAKRGEAVEKLSLDEAVSLAEAREVGLVALDDSLTSLAVIDPQQSRIVELRFFGGLTIEETAEVLGVSPATVFYEWSLARAWLHRQLRQGVRDDT